ncbi:hypothetical protein [Kutzneria kofuensis]|uniref:hypothetical protein n=1 Tax=Kutzneria kofuensis TaxID=103725 RepID=UPI0031E83BD6
MTLDLVPAFEVRQNVFDALPWDALFEHVDEIEDAAYSVSLFTNWANDAVDLAWLKTVGESRTELFGATPADGPRHPAHAAGLPPTTAPSSSVFPGRGTNGCRTSSSASRRASGTSSSPSTSCRIGMPRRRSRRCAGSATGSRRW